MNRGTEAVSETQASTTANAMLSCGMAAERTGRRGLKIRLGRRLDYQTTSAAWREIVPLVEAEAPDLLILDAAQVSYCDASCAALVLHLKRHQKNRQADIAIIGASSEIAGLLDFYRKRSTEPKPAESHRAPQFIEAIGAAARYRVDAWLAELAVLGAMVLALARLIPKLRRCRAVDIFRVIETAGARALPIILLLGFLIGLIIGFQAAVQLRRFGASLFIANVIALSSLRELGPLLTAVVLSGRSGAAFAAEIGTMRVGEEIDALATMGFDPVSFLVVPRLVALMIVAPLLTLFTDVSNLAGGLVVFRTFGFTTAAYDHQMLLAVSYGDLLDGLAKSALFGALVAFIGCLRGFKTDGGAQAVGLSTTSAVVSSLVLVILADGIWAVLGQYVGL